MSTEDMAVTDAPTPQPPSTDDMLPEATARWKRKQRDGSRQVIEWVLLVGGALVIAIVIKTFLFQAFYIPSPSMVPTLKDHDRVLVNKLAYHFHSVHRGDIVVFKAPPNEETAQIKDLVKRVIGLPGDTLESRDGSVYINGRKLSEPYLASGTRTDQLAKTTVAPDMFFVMGDNRAGSKDSRVFGAIKKKWIVGRAFVRMWPLTRLGFL